ncbi:MAG: ribosome silencing factor [Planctomycetota bacterium]|nr:ribosome silencing factor [Planctomycetota bacterium]
MAKRPDSNSKPSDGKPARKPASKSASKPAPKSGKKGMPKRPKNPVAGTRQPKPHPSGGRSRPRKTSSDPRDGDILVPDSAPAAPRERSAVTSADDKRIRNFARDAARLAHDSHCAEVVLLDVRGLSDITDYILIASGASDRQIRSVGEDIEQLAKGSRLNKFGRDADGRSSWVVLDFVDVVVHLFDAVARSHYDLEMMWGDAPKVRWQRKADAATPGAGGESTTAADDAEGDEAEA